MPPFLPPPPLLVQRRVVVTGVGAVSPLGRGVKVTWENILGGKSGIKDLLSADNSGESSSKVSERAKAFPTSLAGAVESDVAGGGGGAPTFIQFAMDAAKEALDMSGWAPRSEEDECRAGVAIGSGIGSLEDVEEAYQSMWSKGYRGIKPRFIPRILVNLAAGHVSISHRLRGPNHTVATACATGAHAIGDAFRFIKFGDADVMVAGGTEGSVHDLSLAGFARMKALSTSFNTEPHRASRPFDRDRDGFVLSEGAAVLVLEEMQHAVQRGANILAEVRGYGLSGDAHHITAPTEDGNGPQRAMRAAVEQSGLSTSDVGYINAHGTSTPLGDAAEGRAIEQLFGSRPSLLVSSTKGATGHMLGAAGSMEAALTVLAIHHGIVPHTLNLDNPEPEFSFTLVRKEPVKVELNAALSNSFGFGGVNVSLLFSRIQ
ncbi:unnamed protein product [Discosporangium mesarthrocarpum]